METPMGPCDFRPPVAEAVVIQNFAIIALAAAATALIFHQLRQPVIIGYLVVGFLVGPFGPGTSLLEQTEGLALLAELGVVFLFFALGLEFNIDKLRKVGATALVAGFLEIALMTWLGYSLGRLFGWPHFESLFLGAVISISSTMVIVKLLEAQGHMGKEWAHLAFGILIVEDIVAVLILTALSSASASGGFQPELLGGLVTKLALFLGSALLLGIMAAPRVVDFILKLRTEEVRVLVVIAIGVGFALLASVLGFSPGLGAFLAGAILAESPSVARIEQRIVPLRDLFTAIFFVTIGALADPRGIIENWPLVLALSAAVVIGKVGGVSTALFITGRPATRAIRAGMTMAQIGEFSYVIAGLGVGLAVVRPDLVAITVAVSAITAFLTPALSRAAPRAADIVSRRTPAGLRAFAATYQTWVSRVHTSDPSSAEWKGIRTNALKATLAAAVTISLFGIGVVVHDDVNRLLPGQPATVTNAGLWLALSLFSAPFVVVWFHAIRAITHALARLAVPQHLQRTAPTTTERLLRRTFGFLAALGTGALILLVATPFINPLFALSLVAVGVGLYTLFLSRSLHVFHRQVEQTIARIEGRAARTREEAIHVIEEARAWGAASREIILPTVSGGGGRTLGELRLRKLTGAGVVSIQSKDGTRAVNPGADHQLQPGDRVLLLGDEDALTRGEEILLGRDLGITGGATEVRLSPTSPLAGRRLDDADLRASGADILLVRRGDTSLPAEADLVFAADDILVVSGTDEQVSAVRARAEPSPHPAHADDDEQ